jgi:putative oxidoreductase
MDFYTWLVMSEFYLAPILLLLVRLYWGWQWTVTGFGKFTKFTKTSQYFASLGIRAAPLVTLLVAFFETLGGISLILGLGVHIMMIPLVVIMICAMVAAHRKAGAKMFKDPMTFVTQPPMTFMLVALFVMVFGAGIFSLDYLLKL